jgi:CRISPR system Cascade subunit CasD
MPSKSGVLGLLAAAEGRRRTDPIEDLLALAFGVRADQPGIALRDFQTARSLDEQQTMPLTHRYYLSDAVFVAGVSGDDRLVDGLVEALRRPRFPLYLGRRACPPTPPLVLARSASGLWEALLSEQWHAARWYARRQPARVQLDVLADELVIPPDRVHTRDMMRDEPESFSPERRSYGWRAVHRATVTVDNPHSRTAGPKLAHDPLEALEVE